MTDKTYTSTLNAGLGMLQEIKMLLDLWHSGMTAIELQGIALESGRFPNISARRLRNFIFQGFAPLCLYDNGERAVLLQKLHPILTNREFEQWLFIYTCRTHAILADFVREVYWNAYVSGRDRLSNEEARAFVVRAVQDGQTTTPWSESTVMRVARYLTSYCADFGLLERGIRQVRSILPYWIEPHVAALLAYDLHFAGLGDNALLVHEDWALFGMDRPDVLEEMKRLALTGKVIVQVAGGVTKINWKYQTMEELIDGLS